MRKIFLRRVMTGLVFLAGLLGGAQSVRAAPALAAYQKMYNLNFEIYLPEELPPGWYATFDGYAVAQVSPNHWVYGQPDRSGGLEPISVAVGSVVPEGVPGLARIAVSPRREGAYDTKAFREITFSGLDNMGILDDPVTPIAWRSGEPGARVWLGDHWFRVNPSSGQATFQALADQYRYIMRVLLEKDAVWRRSDTEELADLAREWGYLWRGRVPSASLLERRDGHSSDVLRDGGGGGPSAPASGGNWDVGGGARESGGRSAPSGGWDK